MTCGVLAFKSLWLEFSILDSSAQDFHNLRTVRNVRADGINVEPLSGRAGLLAQSGVPDAS
jgi:hypothetical protein